MTKFYVDEEGNFIGGFDGTYPENGIEVSIAPNNALDKWNGSEWIPHVAVPSIVEMYQARKALLLADILDNVDEAIAAIPDPMQRRLAQIDWEFSPTVKRDSPLVNGLAGALALTDKMLDDLFIKAASL